MSSECVCVCVLCVGCSGKNVNGTFARVRFGGVEIHGEQTDADKFAIDNPINSPSSLVRARDKSMRCRRHGLFTNRRPPCSRNYF